GEPPRVRSRRSRDSEPRSDREQSAAPTDAQFDPAERPGLFGPSRFRRARALRAPHAGATLFLVVELLRASLPLRLGKLVVGSLWPLRGRAPHPASSPALAPTSRRTPARRAQSGGGRCVGRVGPNLAARIAAAAVPSGRAAGSGRACGTRGRRTGRRHLQA